MIKTFITALRLMWLSVITPVLKIRFIASFIFSIFNGLIAFLSPLVLSELVKQISNNNTDKILFYFYLLVALAVALITVRFIWRHECEIISQVLPVNLKKIYYGKIFHQSYEWLLHNSVGYFSTAVNNVCGSISSLLWQMPFEYMSRFVMAICFLIYLYFLSPWVFLYFLTFLIVMILIARFMYNRRIYYVTNCSKSSVSYGKTFIDFLYNIRSVKKMNLLKFANKNLDEKGNKVIKFNTDMMRYNAYQYGFIEFFIKALFLVPLGYYIYNFIRTGKGIEVIVMLTFIQARFLEFGLSIMSLMGQLARTETDYKILASLLDNKKSSQKILINPGGWHKIHFEKTLFEFTKDDSRFLHKVPNFTIYRGDHLSVTGRSGEGKTTFLNLLTRQFPALGGNIYVDGINYVNLPQSFFDDNMTYISQDVEIFDMTLYDNIVMGKRISKNKLQKIIDGCCLNELIARMDGNMHTDIGEKGVKVSAGEKQRINLARGLLLNRDILIMDEITANLDPVTAKHIWDFIFSEYKEKTIIVVSHQKEALTFTTRRLEFRAGIGTEVPHNSI